MAKKGKEPKGLRRWRLEQKHKKTAGKKKRGKKRRTGAAMPTGKKRKKKYKHRTGAMPTGKKKRSKKRRTGAAMPTGKKRGKKRHGARRTGIGMFKPGGGSYAEAAGRIKIF
jgi:hypothetical protein